MPSRAANHFNRCALLQKGFGCGTRREIRTNAQSVIKHSPPNHLQVVPRHYHGYGSKLLCFRSHGSTPWWKLKSLELPNSFRKGRNFFTAIAVVLPRP